MKSERLLLVKLSTFTIALTASILTAISFSSSAHAAIITVTNGSFEDPFNGGNYGNSYSGNTPNNSVIPGWTLGNTFGSVDNVSTAFASGLTGTYAVYIAGTLAQNTTATFVAGETYTLSLDIGQPTGSTAGTGFNYGFRTANNSGFITDAVIFENGGSTIGTFRNISFSYVAQAADEGNPVIVGFDDFYGGGNNQYLDNVTLTTTALVVPEPSTFLFVASGFAVMAMFNRRRLGHSPLAR